MIPRIIAALVIIFPFATSPSSAEPLLVKDINQEVLNSSLRSSSPDSYMEWNGKVYFTARSGFVYGRMLWMTDGTESGTVPLLADKETKWPEIMGVAGEWLLFHANGSSPPDPRGRELWRTDGTSEGTVPITDVNFGSGYSIAQGPARAGDGSSERLYFIARDDADHEQIWESDGTPEGTVQLSDLEASAQLSRLIFVGDELFFFRSGFEDGDPRRQTSLWKFSAIPGEPTLVAKLPHGLLGGNPPERTMATANGILFFEYAATESGSELWRSDGTNGGTFLVRDIQPDGSSNPEDLSATEDHVYFIAQDELWRSDGTSEGTISLNDAFPGIGPTEASRILATTDHGIYFATEYQDRMQLWFSDGTAEGTVRVADEFPRFTDLYSGALIGDRLVFAVEDDGTGPASQQIWISDGTAAGTGRIAYEPGEGSRSVPMLMAAGDFVFWEGGTAETAAEPWISDGTPEGTGMLKDIAQGNGDSEPQMMGGDGIQLMFSASDGSSGRELWRTDGTPEGTRMVLDIRPGPSSSDPRRVARIGGLHFFAAHDENARQRTLWRTDGTAGGTFKLTVEPAWDPGEGQVLGGEVYFPQATASEGVELWKSDGTVAGTVLVSDVRPGRDSSNPEFLTVQGDRLFFAADHGANGRELWVHDDSGTRMIRNKYLAFGASSDPYGLCAAGSTLYFAANNGVTGQELWQSDGTTDGTKIVRNIRAGAEGSGPRDLVAMGDRLFFTADDGVHGRELWTSDGTSSGTVMILDLNPSSSPPQEFPKHLTVVGDKLFFVTDDGVHGFEWWVSDGTESGTRLLKDFAPGELAGAGSGEIVVVGDRAVFAANSPSTGTELWISDGTPEGTELLPEVNPGFGNSYARPIGAVGGRLYFAALDERYGVEMWSLLVAGETELEVSASDVSFSRQTGLFEQDVIIRNSGSVSAPMIRVLFSGLEPGVGVRNATGMTEAGVPYVDFLKAIPANGAAEKLRIEYFDPTRRLVSRPEITVLELDAAPEPEESRDPFSIERIQRLADGSVMVEFASVPGRRYLVQYSPDGQNWIDCLSQVVAVSNRTQWIDAGPPKTDTPPAEADARFYRVAELVESE